MPDLYPLILANIILTRQCGQQVKHTGLNNICELLAFESVVYEIYCKMCELKYTHKPSGKEEFIVDDLKCIYENANVLFKQDIGEIVSNKRKRAADNEVYEGIVEKKESGKIDYKVKYIGETGKSGYERALNHLDSFRRMEEGSHLMKHYLIHHKEIPQEEMKVGMRIRNTFRSSLERQVGEAVAIDWEKRKGKVLMNSKSEYNRCVIPRISTERPKDQIIEEEEEKLEDEIFRKEIRRIRNEKRGNRIREEMSNINMKRAVLEIQNENIMKWKLRKETQLKEKEENDEKDKVLVEREIRIKKGNEKKKELLSKLRKEGKLAKEKKDSNWIIEKKSLWRDYREKEENPTNEFDISDLNIECLKQEEIQIVPTDKNGREGGLSHSNIIQIVDIYSPTKSTKSEGRSFDPTKGFLVPEESDRSGMLSPTKSTNSEGRSFDPKKGFLLPTKGIIVHEKVIDRVYLTQQIVIISPRLYEGMI